MLAEILSYSRAQSLFAGIDVSGGVMQPDKDANRRAYGSEVTARDVTEGASQLVVPAAAQAFVKALNRDARATTGRK
jgi:lipid-binding SYLF domain-containing protein